MTAPHLWVRAEQRDNETRVGITPEGVTALMAQGFRVTVEASDSRVIATANSAKKIVSGSIAVSAAAATMFGAISDYGVTGRAVQKGVLNLSCINPRSFTEDRHQTVDDRPYGGGPGMVMMPEP